MTETPVLQTPTISELKTPVETLANVGAFCLVIRSLEQKVNKQELSEKVFEERFIEKGKELLQKSGAELNLDAITYKDWKATNLEEDEEILNHRMTTFDELESWYQKQDRELDLNIEDNYQAKARTGYSSDG